MDKDFFNEKGTSLEDDQLTSKKLKFNLKKNKTQDHTELLDQAGGDFIYGDCCDQYWQSEKFSLLYGTPFWDQASESERVTLNHLYWVAYYSQIISAEIATIFLNQTSAAGLYRLKDFRLVCETLDFESMQERAHISAFKKVSEQVESELFGQRIFTFPMKPFFSETMIFQNSNWLKEQWKRFQIQFYSLLSSSNSFLACQYLTVRGLRTLNGKIVQQQLSDFYQSLPEDKKEEAPLPSKISYYHYMDESYHFNSSNLIGTDLLKVLEKPTRFESKLANMAVAGSLKDHKNFTVSVNGIFWHEPSVFQPIYKVFTSSLFSMTRDEALKMIELCFCHMNDGIQQSYATQQVALESYKNYLSDIDYVGEESKLGGAMRESSMERYIKNNQNKLSSFKRKCHV